jgi:hypothetical protein
MVWRLGFVQALRVSGDFGTVGGMSGSVCRMLTTVLISDQRHCCFFINPTYPLVSRFELPSFILIITKNGRVYDPAHIFQKFPNSVLMTSLVARHTLILRKAKHNK